MDTSGNNKGIVFPTRNLECPAGREPCDDYACRAEDSVASRQADYAPRLREMHGPLSR